MDHILAAWMTDVIKVIILLCENFRGGSSNMDKTPNGRVGLDRRRSGLLLHISSLPSAFGVGDFGPEAHRFVSLLAEAGQSLWQVLPLNPTDGGSDYSPYSSISAFAGNTFFISPKLLAEDGLLKGEELKSIEDNSDVVDYDKAEDLKGPLLKKACQRFRGDHNFESFCRAESQWLDDYALFVVLKGKFDKKSWVEWPDTFKYRNERVLEDFFERETEAIRQVKVTQYLFDRQWQVLHKQCQDHDITVIGDMPIYVSHDSADVWSHQELFDLDDRGYPRSVAGVPPDYFSKTGQRWGNPLYKWDLMKERGFEWWLSRFERNLRLFDALRIDHFRGFVAYWAVPAKEETAVRGEWIKACPYDFFDTVRKCFPNAAVIAEDLGLITDDVKAVMRHYGFPGMAVLLFAFGGDVAHNPFAPHNHREGLLLYAGTHDNNTVRGWFEEEATSEAIRQLESYIGHQAVAERVHWDFVRMVLSSVAKWAILSPQDLFGLGAEARMNFPGRPRGNWRWRLREEYLQSKAFGILRELSQLFGRTG